MFENLAAYRRFFGMSVAAAADEAGVSTGLLSEAENGRPPKRKEKKEKLEKYYANIEGRFYKEVQRGKRDGENKD